jgi:hypothetical protein
MTGPSAIKETGAMRAVVGRRLQDGPVMRRPTRERSPTPPTPDSRFLHTRNGTVQGYNAQAVVTEDQVVVAADLTREANDLQQLAPMLAATTTTLAAAGVPQRPGRLLADCGYWSIANLTTIPDTPELLIWPASTGRTGRPRKDGKPSASRSDGLRARPCWPSSDARRPRPVTPS